MPASENIKKLRKQRGWSQARLAMEAHVSQQAISFLERGRNEPSMEMIHALSKAFRISPAEIIGDDSVPEENPSVLEDQLLGIFRLLNSAGKAFLLQQADFILQQPGFRQEPSMSSIG